MEKLRIIGGKRLSGTISISGAKNAALPALAACILTDREVKLANVPSVWDIHTMLKLLFHVGAERTIFQGNGVSIKISGIESSDAPYELVKTMRASILVLGPMLARNGHARVSLPGGCAIGERPVNLHIDGLRRLGAKIEIEHGYIEASGDRLKGAEFTFERRTVTGTENLMMAATLADGVTRLVNCAMEPEVVDLATLLISMGAKITGAGSNVIEIEGVTGLNGAVHEIIPDRIEAGTYIMAGVLAGDRIKIDRCNPSHLMALLEKLEENGIEVESGENFVVVSQKDEIRAKDLRTSTYPGFPTDMQAQYMTLMTQAEGESIITETIFERRFMHVGELLRMGADIAIDGHSAIVKGKTPLKGAQVMATDLRASASLVLAGLIAEGETVIDRIYHLHRGYERIDEKLRGLGASVERVK
ncbi:MAG: UDP-N-acetylglucosamine 1-carboxyvinyltransferase [Acidobacteriota bacterium]